jgi:transcriptional regulator with XRE-family HTH domain
MTKQPQFDEQLRRAIEASDMSQRAVARAVGVDEGNFSKFMSGRIGLSMETTNKVCELLGLELVQRKAAKPAKGKR